MGIVLNMEIYNLFIKILEKITDWAGTQYENRSRSVSVEIHT